MRYEVARPVGQVLVAVALFLILVPLVNVGLQVLPWRPGARDWRFGTWGFLLGAITLPVLGVGILGIAGAVRESLALMRVTLVLALVFLAAALAGLGSFLIEGSSLRAAATDPTMRALFDQELRRTTLVAVVAVPALAAMVWGSFRTAKGLKLILAENQGSSALIQTGAR